jgi:hypothetical protein
MDYRLLSPAELVAFLRHNADRLLLAPTEVAAFATLTFLDGSLIAELGEEMVAAVLKRFMSHGAALRSSEALCEAVAAAQQTEHLARDLGARSGDETEAPSGFQTLPRAEAAPKKEASPPETGT